MSGEIRITIDDDEVFERLKRRKDALDLSWEDALRRGLRDTSEAPRELPAAPDARDGGRERGSRGRGARSGRADRREHRSHRSHRARRERDEPSPFDPDFGERIARDVLASVNESVPGFVDLSLDDEIDRLEDAEDAVLVLGDGEGQRVPLRVQLHTGPNGLDVDVVAVRSGKGTEGMNRFDEGARADIAERFARGDAATLELDGGEETYAVRPDLTWERGPDGAPTVADVAIQEVVFEE